MSPGWTSTPSGASSRARCTIRGSTSATMRASSSSASRRGTSRPARKPGKPVSRYVRDMGQPKTSRSIDQPSLRGPAAELVAGGELELAQHGAHVRLDGLDRDAQALGDLLVEVAAGDVAQLLALARRELVEVAVRVDRRRGRRPAAPARERVEDEARQPRREDGVVLLDAADGLGQLD